MQLLRSNYYKYDYNNNYYNNHYYNDFEGLQLNLMDS